MKKKDLREILTRHADALIHGEDLTSDLVEDYGHKDDQIESLLALATSLKDALVPVADPAPMGADWTALSDSTTSSIIIRQTKRFPKMWHFFAIFGSLLSIVSVAIFVIRRLKFSEKKQNERLTSAALN
jgi:hypothetical protein